MSCTVMPTRGGEGWEEDRQAILKAREQVGLYHLNVHLHAPLQHHKQPGEMFVKLVFSDHKN